MKSKKELLEEHYLSMKDCVKCPLHEHRTKVVYGRGNPEAKIWILGEGPGKNEDIKGIPFCGQAGQILDEITTDAGFKKSDFFITNISKCRPWDGKKNRPPTDLEAESCLPYLYKQMMIIEPTHMICVGRTAATQLLKLDIPSMAKARKKIHERRYPNIENKPKVLKVLVTYHPAYVLRNREVYKDIVEDFCFLGNCVFGDNTL